MKQRIASPASSSIRLSLGLICAVACPMFLSAASVEVMAGKDLPFCEKVAKLFGDRLVPDGDLLKTVEWKTVELKGQAPRTRHCSSLDKTIVDIDNDGQQDLVVKTTFCMRGAPSDSLYVLPTESSALDQASWQDLSSLLATSDKFERTGGTYPLTALSVEKTASPPPLTTLFHIQPFLLDGVAYVGLTDARREWMVIAKYSGGDRFEDQCYLRAGKF